MDASLGTIQDITCSSSSLHGIDVASSYFGATDVINMALFFLRLSSVDGLTVVGRDEYWSDVQAALCVLRQAVALARADWELGLAEPTRTQRGMQPVSLSQHHLIRVRYHSPHESFQSGLKSLHALGTDGL